MGRQEYCPNCNYPDESSGYHYRGKYIQGKKCSGCGYTESFTVQTTELQISQRCLVSLNESLKILVVVDRSDAVNPSYKFFTKINESLTKFEPTKVQNNILIYYANQEWSSWLKTA